MNKLNLWIGLECTLNRVGNIYFDQLEKSGHYGRGFDLQKFSMLNPQRIRYPFLWEKAAPKKEGVYDWSLFDVNLQNLKMAGLTPIVGLLHHGSGPFYTNLLDPHFPEKFARYAKDFAHRYPFLNDYTPINEILTTASFSCLYGHWYPHQKNDKSFIRACYNECRATILAMKEIRKVNPAARLIQTEDFDNTRRFLSFDLLCGKVTVSHPFYDFLLQELSEEELKWLEQNPCAPDVLGINHHLLSNRYLDERLERYPESDVAMVDFDIGIPTPTPYSIFKEVWDRYHIPLAITEVHARGHREDQIRWFWEIWNAAKQIQAEEIPIEAVTAWSLLGTFNWNSLCTTDENFYEPGVFDLRTSNGEPRVTGLYHVIKRISQGEKPKEPVLAVPGWWKNPQSYNQRNNQFSFVWNSHQKEPLLIVGGRGTLGKAFARICSARNIPFILLNRNQLDIASILQLRQILNQIKPWAVVNAAGMVNIDEAERNEALCYRENIKGPKNLAQECKIRDIPLLTFSTDQVFGGEKNQPYFENDYVAPLNVYGQSKVIAEKKVLSIHDKVLVVRTSSFFGPWDESNFVINCLKTVSKNEYFSAAKNVSMSPTYIPDLVHACLDLLIDRHYGLVHLANSGVISWFEFAKSIVSFHSKLKADLIVGYKAEDQPVVARRPSNSALASEHFNILPPLEQTFSRFFKELEINF
ncbi:MAG: SDR family oxidoreductase [Bdellovibrio sp.]